MFTQRITWNGTEQEACDLLQAIARNCACKFGSDGARTVTCEPHAGLVHDQRWLDGMLLGRYIANRLIEEEWR
jgi:hypothetical protein